MPQKSGDIREELEQITRAPQKQKKRTVCVIGHKNPDTDSICAAISYTYLKKQLEKPDGRYQYVACRAGSVSAETQFVLDYFHVPQPLFIENIGTRVKDLEIRRTPGVDAKISVKDAWNLMNTQNVFTLPNTDAESHSLPLIRWVRRYRYSSPTRKDPRHQECTSQCRSISVIVVMVSSCTLPLL